MNIIKKISVIALAAVLAVVSVISSSVAWYPHNENTEGKVIKYANDNLELSLKSASDSISMVTYEANERGIATDTTVNSINLPHNETQNAVKYYKSVFTNTGSNDVMVDLETNALPNDADFFIGTTSPTINEKAYASRSVKTKATNNVFRVYFKTHNDYKAFWGKYEAADVTYTNNGSINTAITNDMNIAYKVAGGADETYKKLIRCGTDENYSGNNPASLVFYADIPTDVEYFYFFNHWYFKSSTNREWNRTINITDKSLGRLYYLTGNRTDKNYKEYKANDVNTNLVGLISYYKTVRMSNGSTVFSDISLKKESDTGDEDFVPDYYGNSISYSIKSGAATDVVSVNSYGLITPIGTGSTVVRTTITGVHGDSVWVDTTVEIPDSITEVPILKNIRVPAQGTTTEDGSDANRVEVDWYAINKSSSQNMTTTSIYFTV